MKNRESKYKIVVNDLIDQIKSGKYRVGDRLPSISDFIAAYKLSRTTVFQAINELKARGIIESAPGMGYFVLSTNFKVEHKIFMLFNEFNLFKEDLYNSFMKSIDNSATVDLVFHNYDRQVFETLLSEANGKYTTYIIMPGKFEGIGPLLEKLNGRVFLLDHFHMELKDQYSSVFQNFAKDTYHALVSGGAVLKKYNHFIMVQQHEKEPLERYHGLQRFCDEYGFKHSYTGSAHGKQICPGQLYIVVDDRDLVHLIKQSEFQGMTLGKDFGIISYNETPLKEVLAGGITTISTDFIQMGKTMSMLINYNEIQTIENPCRFNIRKSI